MNERIMISDFVKQIHEFKDDQEKMMEYLNSIILRTYAPVMEKRVVLETLLYKAIITDPNGTQYIDQFLAKINLKLAIVILYTKLQIESIQSDRGKQNIYDEYDALQEIDAFSALTYFIGEKEAKELSQIQECIINTFYDRHSSTEAVINRFIENLDVIFKIFESKGLSIIQENMNKEEKMEEVDA